MDRFPPGVYPGIASSARSNPRLDTVRHATYLYEMAEKDRPSDSVPGSDLTDRDYDEADGLPHRRVPDALKRLLYAGVGAVITSEEGVRRLAKEFSLPKDVANFLAAQAQSTKNEIFRIVAREVRDFLQGVNFGQEMTKILTSLKFEVKMQVRLLPNESQNAVRPDIKADVRVLKSNGSEIEE